MHMRRIALSVLVGSLMISLGCGSAGTAFSMFQNSQRTDSYLKVWLDGQLATQDAMKKTVSGYARFTIDTPVSTSPTLKFEIMEADKFGRITQVSTQIHQKHEADYSHQAEFAVYAASNDPQSQMKPNTDYSLGSPAGQKVMDLYSKEVSGVTLKPGMEYMLVLTVKADKSESVQVYFKTR